ncbi:MarR family transcriptional regulator [Deinococcus aetherius]|uniref:MarR family transcriptional regulator n=1 Tax=Deinococcus aetherius TaxID=200252 RepID=A0ABM8AC56_9DEIO|nr:MarR family winged helix-turn-helix transcriptional regulator [Deinococcus aetherius]BDP41369.1 MarR family transcriptional regulator [Deinococcus aetherius]
MAYSPAGLAFSDLVVLIFRLNGTLLKAGDRMTAPVGQTSARWQVLGVIDERPMTVAAIARTMGLTRQSVQRTADLLVEDGLAAYEDNPEHRRAKLLRLLPLGQEVLNVIEASQQDWANRVGEAVGESELSRAVTLLERLLLALDREEGRGGGR